MKTADVVIGANFGDEGKGLVTDFLSAPHAGHALVVRYNGGAQAGHTVETPDGRRHVFSHFGSGSFVGAPTFLPRFFVCNPLLFMKEHTLLAQKSVSPHIIIDKRAPITTPYDMMINQMAEDMRGPKRHGSCGVGFGETLERHQHADLALTYADLPNTAALKRKLAFIRADWLPKRIVKLGLGAIPEIWLDRIVAGGVVDKFIEDTEAFLALTRAGTDDFLGMTRGRIIFEGAQGLLLDQDRGIFPHVTRSNTGLKNVITLAKDADIGGLDVHYITRAYMTRHGAGPLDFEQSFPPTQKVEDATNVHNAYQGTLRFAPLDLDSLSARITADMQDADGITLAPRLAVTCLDQLDAEVTFVKDSTAQAATQDSFLETLKTRTGISSLLLSRGPTRATIEA